MFPTEKSHQRKLKALTGLISVDWALPLLTAVPLWSEGGRDPGAGWTECGRD